MTPCRRQIFTVESVRFCFSGKTISSVTAEEAFIKVYCEILGVSESTARYAYMYHDSFTSQETLPTIGRTATARVPGRNVSRNGAVLTAPRDEVKGLGFGINSAPATA